MNHLQALINSKDTKPPARRKKKNLQDIWDELKDKADWKHNVFFKHSYQVEIDELKELLA